jgi:hypothetical protein
MSPAEGKVQPVLTGEKAKTLHSFFEGGPGLAQDSGRTQKPHFHRQPFGFHQRNGFLQISKAFCVGGDITVQDNDKRPLLERPSRNRGIIS